MMKTRSFRGIFGVLIFAIGVLASTLLTGGLTWAGLEAALYGFPRYTTERFDGLYCPLLMTRRETGLVRITVHNQSDRAITPIMTINLSSPGLIETRKVQVAIPAGETQQLEQKISSANIDRQYFIFAKANRSASYPVTTAEAVCGTVVLDVPVVSGIQILYLWLGLGLVCTPLGLWIWRSDLYQPAKMPSLVKALAVTSLGSLLFSLNGFWMLGVLFLVVIVLMVQMLPRR